ncbi:MAG: Uncharacterized protein G01um101425_1022 [Candidatus Peregrinibacteria bacterium Gr01-1014_25]|nr:MAG: Uncharacterized protein G01um101425_1022 [Candidatus Peregrinibacteria bacterium Gr01-1014_25]
MEHITHNDAMRAPLMPCAALLACLLLAGCLGGPPAPIGDARRRPTALRFGMYVTPEPEHNPIDPPERFTGYHAGLDYEVFAAEIDADVPIYAICGGSVLHSGYANGYGNVVIQRCQLRGDMVTVLYGHLDDDELPPDGTVLMSGDRIGVLAAPRSDGSAGNRKHLHLGIHRGEEIEYRGYVDSASELEEFIDPAAMLPRRATGRPVEEFHVPPLP